MQKGDLGHGPITDSSPKYVEVLVWKYATETDGLCLSGTTVRDIQEKSVRVLRKGIPLGPHKKVQDGDEVWVGNWTNWD